MLSRKVLALVSARKAPSASPQPHRRPRHLYLYPVTAHHMTPIRAPSRALPLQNVASSLRPVSCPLPTNPNQHQHQHEPQSQPSVHFSTSHPLSKKSLLPPRPTVPESETYKSYLKGSGPGGQKINKTSSAVQLTHLPTGIVVKSQATRSRTQNESIARRILAERVEVLEKGSESRVEKKRELVSKKKRSAEKKRRRKYRALTGKDGDGEIDEDEVIKSEEGRSESGGTDDGVELEKEARRIDQREESRP